MRGVCPAQLGEASMKEPHPDYGLTREFRLQVLATAGQIGVRAAAIAHAVSKSSVYRWRKWYSQDDK
jgi:hypothetical protein